MIFRKFEKRKVHSSFIDKIWGADLTYMKLLSKYLKFYYALLIFTVNMHELFHGEVR